LANQGQHTEVNRYDGRDNRHFINTAKNGWSEGHDNRNARICFLLAVLTPEMLINVVIANSHGKGALSQFAISQRITPLAK